MGSCKKWVIICQLQLQNKKFSQESIFCAQCDDGGGASGAESIVAPRLSDDGDDVGGDGDDDGYDDDDGGDGDDDDGGGGASGAESIVAPRLLSQALLKQC